MGLNMNKKKIPAAVKNHTFRFRTGGNRKLDKSVATWSTLATDSMYIVPALGNFIVRGTCSSEACKTCKKDCYARKAQNMYPSVVYGRAVNTIGLRYLTDKLFADLDKQLGSSRRRFSIVRLNQSGELETEHEMELWAELARRHPDVTLYIYTKMYDFATVILKAGLVPENLIILFSIWKTQGVKEYNAVKRFKNVKAFVVDNDAFKCDAECPAYKKTGKLDSRFKCGGTCTLCTSLGTVKRIRCKNH